MALSTSAPGISDTAMHAWYFSSTPQHNRRCSMLNSVVAKRAVKPTVDLPGGTDSKAAPKSKAAAKSNAKRKSGSGARELADDEAGGPGKKRKSTDSTSGDTATCEGTGDGALILDGKCVGSTWIEDVVMSLGCGSGQMTVTHAVAMQIAMEFAWAGSVTLDEEVTFVHWSQLRKKLIGMVSKSEQLAKATCSTGSAGGPGATSIGQDPQPDDTCVSAGGVRPMTLQERTSLLAFLTQIKGQHIRFHRCRIIISMNIETTLAELYESPGRTFLPFYDVFKVVVRQVCDALPHIWFMSACDGMDIPHPVFNNSTFDAGAFMAIRVQHVMYALRETLTVGFMSDTSHVFAPSDPAVADLVTLFGHSAVSDMLATIDRRCFVSC